MAPHVLNVSLICSTKSPRVSVQSLCGLPPCYRGDDAGLFTHLHTVNVDLVAWPAGDSQLLDSHPAAHTVLEATHRREESLHRQTFHLLSSFSSPFISF